MDETSKNNLDALLAKAKKSMDWKEKAKKEIDVFEEIIDIIDSENSGQSAEQRLDEIKELIKIFNR